MELIGIMKVQRFARGEIRARGPMAAWVVIVQQAEWRNPHDVKATFAHADFLGKGLVVFNVGGNKYRISANVSYKPGKVMIRHVMDHNEYDGRTQSGTL